MSFQESEIIRCEWCNYMFDVQQCPDWSDTFGRCEWCCDDNHTCPSCRSVAVMRFKGMKREFTEFLMDVEKYWETLEDPFNEWVVRLSETSWWSYDSETIKKLEQYATSYVSDSVPFKKWVSVILNIFNIFSR